MLDPCATTYAPPQHTGKTLPAELLGRPLGRTSFWQVRDRLQLRAAQGDVAARAALSQLEKSRAINTWSNYMTCHRTKRKVFENDNIILEILMCKGPRWIVKANDFFLTV